MSLKTQSSELTAWLCSWILTSWNLMNFEPRVWRKSLPLDLFVVQSDEGHWRDGTGNKIIEEERKTMYCQTQYRNSQITRCAPPSLTAHMECITDSKFFLNAPMANTKRIGVMFEFPLLSRDMLKKRFLLYNGKIVVFPPLLSSRDV